MMAKTQRITQKVLNLISESKSLAISRFADGEASILKNLDVGNRDGWKYVSDKKISLLGLI